ncbi:reverse transcriptase domain-containing protein [Tanacetum coccineum]
MMQETDGYFFCLDNRALLCRKCDLAFHKVNSLVSSHQWFLLTGVKKGLETTDVISTSTVKSILFEKIAEAAESLCVSVSENNHDNNVLPVQTAEVCDFAPPNLPFGGGSSADSIQQWQFDDFFGLTDLNQDYNYFDSDSSKGDNFAAISFARAATAASKPKERKKEKLEEVKARLEFGEARKKTTRAQESAYFESRTTSLRRQRRSRSPRHNPSVFTRLRRERSRSSRHEYKDKARREGTMFKRLESRGRSKSVYSDNGQESSRYTKGHSESEDSEGGHWKSKSRRKKSSVEDDDLSQPWVCAETDPFTSRIRHFDFPKTRMPSHVKTYNGSEDPEDHLKIFQAAAKTERWAMPTWCHMFNSTLTGNARVWFDDLPPESIDSYNDLREAFLKNYLQQKKCIRDPIVLHNIKQRDGESTEDFIQRYKSESGNVKGAPKCMRISEFVHGITNPELIKIFHEKILKTVHEMMQVSANIFSSKERSSLNQRKGRKLLMALETPGKGS